MKDERKTDIKGGTESESVLKVWRVLRRGTEKVGMMRRAGLAHGGGGTGSR